MDELIHKIDCMDQKIDGLRREFKIQNDMLCRVIQFIMPENFHQRKKIATEADMAQITTEDFPKYLAWVGKNISLDAIFEDEFLHHYNYGGKRGMKNIVDNPLYVHVYKNGLLNQGMEEHEIVKKCKLEIERAHGRWRTKKSRSKYIIFIQISFHFIIFIISTPIFVLVHRFFFDELTD
uniref:CSON014972 protein n=1 Tax=Culicoides sonorensis TaxID=179676 RepID=A0A336KDJ8_CULSO